jgi:hypothetical protein
MAIIKTDGDTKGNIGEYWKIVGKKEDELENYTEVDLACYKNKAARQENVKNYIWRSNGIIIDGINLTKAQIYEAVKQLPNWGTVGDDV